ncbi:MAG: sulfite exporter TauE/SafE family protein [Desulfobacterota bacterium]|nr:sulfite exporter TauE/SafE family protein [Thermodesulfobacteriota bacterium]
MIEKFDLYLQGAPLLALLTSFGAGVLTSFTPCIYPLIPVTIGVIGAKGASHRAHAFLLSLLYVIGLAVVYAGLGIFAALTGKLFGTIGSSAWTYLVVGNLFLLFGLSMLEVFSLQLVFPRAGRAGTGRAQGLLSVFFFGCVSALIAGPCTTPVLGAVLAYVASRQHVLFGALMLFVFALGMGFLLVLVGTFTGMLTALPRSGSWMVTLKKAFGFLMIGIGEYFIFKAGQLML